MWTGVCFYPTVDDYVKEARDLGCCRRIGRVPTTVERGESRVFLAHDDGLVGDGFVFGYFVVERVEILIDFLEDIPPHLVGAVEPVFRANLREPERDCGVRDEVGSLYLMGTLTELEPVRRLERFDPGRKHFRGCAQVAYGDRLVKATLKADTMLVPSRLAAERFDGQKRPRGWTRRQDRALLQLFERGRALGKSNSRTAQEMAFRTGRLRVTVLCRYHQLRRELVEGE